MRKESSEKPHDSWFGGWFEDAFSVALLALAILGFVGGLYKALQPTGWIGASLGGATARSPVVLWTTGFGCALMVLLSKWWMDHTARDKHGGDLLIYAFMALGLFFLVKLAATGSL